MNSIKTVCLVNLIRYQNSFITTTNTYQKKTTFLFPILQNTIYTLKFNELFKYIVL
jgi:hypothetical protein